MADKQKYIEALQKNLAEHYPHPKQVKSSLLINSELTEYTSAGISDYPVLTGSAMILADKEQITQAILLLRGYYKAFKEMRRYYDLYDGTVINTRDQLSYKAQFVTVPIGQLFIKAATSGMENVTQQYTKGTLSGKTVSILGSADMPLIDLASNLKNAVTFGGDNTQPDAASRWGASELQQMLTGSGLPRLTATVNLKAMPDPEAGQDASDSLWDSIVNKLSTEEFWAGTLTGGSSGSSSAAHPAPHPWTTDVLGTGLVNGLLSNQLLAQQVSNITGLVSAAMSGDASITDYAEAAVSALSYLAGDALNETPEKAGVGETWPVNRDDFPGASAPVSKLAKQWFNIKWSAAHQKWVEDDNVAEFIENFGQAQSLGSFTPEHFYQGVCTSATYDALTTMITPELNKIRDSAHKISWAQETDYKINSTTYGWDTDTPNPDDEVFLFWHGDLQSELNTKWKQYRSWYARSSGSDAMVHYVDQTYKKAISFFEDKGHTRGYQITVSSSDPDLTNHFVQVKDNQVVSGRTAADGVREEYPMLGILGWGEFRNKFHDEASSTKLVENYGSSYTWKINPDLTSSKLELKSGVSKTIYNRFVAARLAAGPDLFSNLYDVVLVYNDIHSFNEQDKAISLGSITAEVFGVRTGAISVPLSKAQSSKIGWMGREVVRPGSRVDCNRKTVLTIRVDQGMYAIDAAEQMTGRTITVTDARPVNKMVLQALTNSRTNNVEGCVVGADGTASIKMLSIFLQIRSNTIGVASGLVGVPSVIDGEAPLYYVYEDVRFLGESDIALTYGSSDPISVDLPFIFRRGYFVRPSGVLV